MSNVPPAAILLFGAALLPLLPRFSRSVAFLLFPVGAFLLLVQLEIESSISLGFLGFDLVPVQVDRLNLAFGYVFVLIAFLGGIYSFHLNDIGQQVAALIYAGSSLGVVFAGDLLTLFVYWELMALASVCLILACRTERSRRAGMRYLLVHLFGGSVLLVGILWYFVDTGSLLFERFDRGAAA